MGEFSLVFVILLLLSGTPRGGTDMLALVSTTTYWQAKNITPTLQQLEADAGPDQPAANVDAQIKAMQSDDFATRDKAHKALESMGPPIIPQLRVAMKSPDAEVSAVATELVKQFTERAQERANRRLMAIRTLGEHKEQAALPLLKLLEDSKELFVSDYAQQAVAQIEGKTLEHIDLTKAMEHDLGLLPLNTGMVLQTTGTGQENFTFTTLLDQMVDAMNQNRAGQLPGVGGPGGGNIFPGPNGGMNKQQMLMTITKRSLSLLDRVGNIRMDGMTVAISDNIGDRHGWVILMVRGKYNSHAVLEALKATQSPRGDDNGAPPSMRAALFMETDIPIFETGDNEPVLILPSDELMLMVTGPRGDDTKAALSLMLSAVKAGQGTVGRNATLAKLMKTVDMHSPVWGIGTISPDIKKELDWLTGIDSITLESKRTPAGGGVTFTFKGQGSDADKVKASADSLTQGIGQMQMSIKQEALQMPALQSAVDFAMSLKVASDGKNATFTGEIKPTILQSFLATMGSEIFYLLGAVTNEGAGRDAVQGQAVNPPGN